MGVSVKRTILLLLAGGGVLVVVGLTLRLGATLGAVLALAGGVSLLIGSVAAGVRIAISDRR